MVSCFRQWLVVLISRLTHTQHFTYINTDANEWKQSMISFLRESIDKNNSIQLNKQQQSYFGKQMRFLKQICMKKKLESFWRHLFHKLFFRSHYSKHSLDRKIFLGENRILFEWLFTLISIPFEDKRAFCSFMSSWMTFDLINSFLCAFECDEWVIMRSRAHD